MSTEDYICDEDTEREEEERADTPDSLSSPSVNKRARKQKALKPSIKCHLCNRNFTSSDGYNRHLQIHLAEDLYKSAPGLLVAIELCRPEAKALLFKMQTTDFESEFRHKVCEIATRLYTQAENNNFTFVDCIIEELWCCIPTASMIEPSTLNSKFVQNVSHLLANNDKRKEFSDVLQETISPLACASDVKVLSWFVCDFVLKLSDVVEVLYLRCVKNPRETILLHSRQAEIEDSDYVEEENSSLFKQTVHYIGGSVVKSVFRLARKSRGNVKWDKISVCLQARFVSGELINGVDEEISKWTESRSRGGLTFVSEYCWRFFMALSGILEKNEKPDGSIFHNEILSIVLNDDTLMFLWGDLVGEDLSEEENYLLLSSICKYFTNAWGRGVALRRKNAIVGRSRDKVALRSSLCNKN